MSGGSISTSETRIEALQLQSSAFGATIPLVFGVTRIAGNLLWYGGFKAVPHTTETSGKGGGVKVQNTTYTYTASLAMGLCHGRITGMPRIWRGKKVYDGGVTASQVLTAQQGYSVPGSGPMTTTLALSGGTFAAMIGATAAVNGGSSFENGYDITLAEGIDYTVSSAGVVTLLNEGLRGIDVQLGYQYTTGSISQTALDELGLSLKLGAIGQALWSGLAAYPDNEIAYSGLAYVAGQDYDLGTGAAVDNHGFEVVGPMAYHLGPTVPDVDTSVMLRTVLTQSQGGAGFPGALLDSWERWSDYCVAAGLLVSPALTEQVSAADIVRTCAELTNTGPVWSAGRLKMVPYADADESGNGRTFDADTVPVYELDDNAYTPQAAGDSPIRVRDKAPSERHNHVRVEFRSRAKQYNVEIAEAKDQADIDATGLRSREVLRAHWICTAAIARKVAQILMQRSLAVTAEYTVPLPWHYALVEPMDLVTLTDTVLGMDKVPTRVTVVEESEAGDLLITCEDYPPGTASAALYPSQAGDGFSHNYNATPGNVAEPVFLEAPVERTTTGLEVYCAVRGQGPDWGGCGVWVSLDGGEYKRVASVYGPARYGVLAASITSTATSVQVDELADSQLKSGSVADAAALATLCWVGGSSPEYFAHQTATLTGPGAYTLSGLLRGSYGSTKAAHTAGAPFVRVDDALAKSGPLDLSYIGKAISFKFTSFNIYGGGEQSLADVDPYVYTVLGTMAALPPSAPTGLDHDLEPFGIRFFCKKNPEPDVVAYEWRVGSTWASAQVLERNGGTSYLWAVQSVGIITAWVAAVDALGNVSAPSSMSITVSAGTVASLSAAIVGPDLQLDFTGAAGAFAIAGYELRWGDTYATATVLGVFTVTRHTRRVDWGGRRRWWVATVDVRGNLGTARSTDVTIAVPGTVASRRAEVVDNNVLLFWQPPATGSLPVDRYEVRKGATYAGGTTVGSNGNSTFAAVFEQASGVYTYWLAAIDSAGNVGTAGGITATVAQPPDYVLRTSVDSTFTGTKTNLYVEAGTLVGPVNTSQTWATHYTANGYTTPADQIAAGNPLYAQPSVTSGSYDETFDYGATLPATSVTVTPQYTVLDGTVTVSCQIYSKLLVGDPWTAAAPGFGALITAPFRYVRYVLSVACTAGANLIAIDAINLKLSNKLRTDSGSFTITNATAGVVVPFNLAFIDTATPLVQPAGTTPLVPVVDFVDAANPTDFTVYLYNQAGAKVTGSGSWTARGY